MPEIMTLKDVAKYLRINERTVAKLAHEGKIPSFKVASQWRFSREAIDSWFTSQMQQTLRPGEEELPRPELSGLLYPAAVRLELSGRSKGEVLTEMTGLLAEGGFVTSAKKLLDALTERERLCSTGIGRGLAFLHPRRVLTGVVARPVVAVGRSTAGVEFGAVDGAPVHLFFLDCAASERMHLSVLARLSRVLADDGVLESLRGAANPEEAIAILKSAEDRVITG